MTDYVNLDAWPCGMTADDEGPAAPWVADTYAVRGPTGDVLAFAIDAEAAEVLRGAVDHAEGRDASQAAARERAWQRDIAQRERDQARRELADLREAHADRLRQHQRVTRDAIAVLAARDRLRSHLVDALDALDRIGPDAGAADRGAGEH